MADNENKRAREETTEEKQEQVSLDEDSMDKSDLSENLVDEEEKTENETKDMDDSDGDGNKESDKPEELPPGLLEQPLEVKGKREKKKVDRLSAAMVPATKEKKKIEIEDGSGLKLSEVPYIENKVNTTKALDLKPLHHLLFLPRMVSRLDMKKNIRQFCGFTHAKDSKEHEKRVTYLNKMVLPEIKSVCLTLGLDKRGTKSDLVERIMDFLMKPTDMGVKIPEKVKRKPKSPAVKTGEKRKRAPKTATKKSKPKPKVTKKADKDEDDDGSLDEDDDDDEGDEDGTEDEAPKKKKAKVETKKSSNVSKQNGKKEKTSVKKETKKVTPKKKKKAPSISDDSLSDDSDSDDETLINLKKNVPPSNDEIKVLVKKILDGADLETVTMKTVVKQVYGEYPSFDLSDRKDFIKETVREIIS